MKKKSALVLLSSIVLSTIALGMTSCSSSNPSVSQNIENSISNVTITGELKNEYYKGESFDFSSIKFLVEYKNKTSEEITGNSAKIEKNGDNTLTVGKNYSITLSYYKYSKTFNYSVRNPIINLDFDGGTYNNSTDSVSVEAPSSLTNISSYSPTSSEEGYEFAGWFYDKEHTQRVESAVDGYVNITKDTTIYAGYDKDYSNLFNYKIENGEVTLTSLKLTQDTILDLTSLKEIVIPTTIKLYPVTKIINNSGFINSLYSPFIALERIVFPKDSYVKEIGDNVFREYAKFQNIELPDSLEIIGNNAFSNAGLFDTLTLPKSLKRIGESAFEFCKFKKIDFSKSTNLKLIGTQAFRGCENISELNLPDSLLEIRKEAFSNCYNLTNIHMGTNLFNIGVHAFSGCTELVGFDVDEKNSYYKSIDGNLYSKDGTTFIRYCFGKQETEFTLPEGVTEIYESAFDIYHDISPLKVINLPNTLSYIGDNAFSDGDFTFTLPSSLINIAPHAFNNWKGSEFKISRENQVFSVNDGILYSSDQKSLVSVPYLYHNENFVLNPKVETIWTGAIYSNETIKYFTIPEDSNLTRIEEGGFVPFALKSLVGVYIEKEVPFSLDRNAAYSSDYYFNGNFFIFIDEKYYDAYISAWKNYEYDASNLTYFDLYINHYLIKKQEAPEKIYNKVLDSLYVEHGYTLEQLNTFYDNLDFNFYTLKNPLYIIDSYYHLNMQSDYDVYFETIELKSYEIITSYYSSISDADLGYEQNAISFLNRFDDIPQSTRDQLSTAKTELYAIMERTNNVIEIQHSLVDKIIDYSKRLKTIDYDEVQKFMDDYEKYSISLVTLARNIFAKYYMILVSNSIHSLLTSGPEITALNVAKIATIIFGDGYVDLGIDGYLCYFVSSQNQIDNLYGYDEYITYKENYLSYLDKCNNDIINYDFNAAYDEDYAFELYYAYTLMPDSFRNYDALDNYVGIVLRININYFINYDLSDGITDELNTAYHEIENDFDYFDLISEEEQNLFGEKEKEYLELLNKSSTTNEE